MVAGCGAKIAKCLLFLVNILVWVSNVEFVNLLIFSRLSLLEFLNHEKHSCHTHPPTTTPTFLRVFSPAPPEKILVLLHSCRKKSRKVRYFQSEQQRLLFWLGVGLHGVKGHVLVNFPLFYGISLLTPPFISSVLLFSV